MGTRLHNRNYLRRALWVKQSLAISSFTVFLLGFALVYWIFHMFTVVTTVECEYAIIWLTGWYRFEAAFEWLSVAIIMTFAVWLLRLITLRGLSRIETLFQLIFILGLTGAFLAQKAFLFPYATPSRVQVERVTQVFMPMRLRLEEEKSIIFDYTRDWKFDYPPPPFAERPDPPWWDEDSSTQLTDIFQDSRSPLYSEYKRLRACHTDYLAAIAQYEDNIQTWNEYWEDFEIWYARNGWRYPDQPRPFWW